MKVYTLTKPVLIFVWGILIFLAAGGIFLALRVAAPSGAPPEARWLILVWLGFLLWIGYFYLKIPFKISLGDDNLLEFKSVVRTTVVAPRDIVSIKAMPLSLGFINVKHRGGKLRLMCQITGLYELIYTVKTLNPEVEIEGC
jgi:hypothetical protein